MHLWPSGLRRRFQAPLISISWVQIPQGANFCFIVGTNYKIHLQTLPVCLENELTGPRLEEILYNEEALYKAVVRIIMSNEEDPKTKKIILA